MRDCEGNLIWAFANFYGNNTNMVAETSALLNGLEKCVASGYFKVDLESDSLTLIQILKHQIGVPWYIWYSIKKIEKLLEGMDVGISHTYRESNTVADFLANFGCTKKVFFLC